MLEWLTQADEFFIEMVHYFGAWAYLICFLMVFGECGLVPMIFLPGDGFIFSIGVVAAAGGLEIEWIYPLLIVAAILGYQTNFYTGRWFGKMLIQRKSKTWVKEAHLLKGRQFFLKYGRKAIFFGRFVPIIRTVTPFVGGISKMGSQIFMVYNVLGGIIWITLFLLGGYFLGNYPFVAENFLWIYLAMILMATVPSLWAAWSYTRKSGTKNEGFTE